MDTAELQSLFNKRKRRIKHISRLRFSATPVTLQDPIPELYLADEDSSEVHSFEQWLQAKARKLSGSASTSDRDLAGRKSRLLKEFHQALDQLQTLKATQWEREQARAGLFGGLDPYGEHGGPLEVDNGE